jgi:hypothetical protein
MPKIDNYLVSIIEPKQRKYFYWLNIIEDKLNYLQLIREKCRANVEQ